MRKLSTALMAAAVLAACDGLDSPLEPAADAQFSSVTATGPAGAALYEIQVTNLTDGQPLTPPLVATHRPPIDLFDVGQPASAEIQQIAENGNLGPMVEALEASKHVAAVVVAVGNPVPPLLPGETRSFTIAAETGAKHLSMAAMLICTNDGFTGINGVRLPRDIGSSLTIETNAYDAGTATTTENFDNLVPPCGPLTGIDSGGAGTGMSDPALAEGGVIHPHEGISGAADLLTELHGWADPVARVVITRVQ